MGESSDEAKARLLIQEVMEREGITPDDVPQEGPFNKERFIEDLKSKCWSKRYFRGRAYGEFKCNKELCNNEWNSPHASCVLDLKDQKMVVKFKQECALKLDHVNMEQLDLQDRAEAVDKEDMEGVVEPFFCDESLKKMVEWAVDLFLQLTGRKERKQPNNGDNYRSTPPHRDDLCELCIKGVPCVFKKNL